MGRNISLTCSVSGNPRPTVTWYKEETLLRDGTDGVELREDNRSLVIWQTKPQHAGRYTCQATNVVTDLSRQRTVTVRSSSDITVLGNSPE